MSITASLIVAPTLSATSTASAATTTAPQVVGYYNQWDMYGNAYYLKNLVQNGSAARLTTLIYAFENIDPVNLTCFQTIKATDTNEGNPNGGDGAGDAWADYQKPFDATTSISGKADSPLQQLKGNFNQLRQLKAKYPNLKILVSLGGWTFSKYFSNTAATSASRQKFVKSCIDMYMRGNLPTNVAGDKLSSGLGAAANIFDGVDIDWEFPASSNGHLGNHTGPQDTANYTLLLAEFRRQLDALGGAHRLLTAAVPSGPADIALVQANRLGQYLDWADVMAYDMHGAWENSTNLQDPLQPSPNDPAASSGFTVQNTVNVWRQSGLPANKLVVGIPFYWRGWTGVPAGTRNGLYQSATGPSAPFPTTITEGTAAYKELKAAGKLAKASFDAVTQSSYIYDGNNFYTGDTPQAITAKTAFIRQQQLAGAMIYSLDNDDPPASLLTAVDNGIHGRSQPAVPYEYVALGDSFSAGEGIEPFWEPNNQCHRSRLAYSAYIEQPGVKGTSIYSRMQSGATSWGFQACSGATTTDVLGGTGYRGPSNKDPLAQLDTNRTADVGNSNDLPVDLNTKLVTITIGGNDVGFVDIVTFCGTNVNCTTNPYKGQPLLSYINGKLNTLGPALDKVYGRIHMQAPNAKIIVAGYPQLFPGSPNEQNCGKLAQKPVPGGWYIGFSQPEQNFLRGQTSRLNQVIADHVTRATNATFVPVDAIFKFHEICGNSGEWINAATLSANSFPPFNDQSFHPNAAGQRLGYAAAINGALNGVNVP